MITFLLIVIVVLLGMIVFRKVPLRKRIDVRRGLLRLWLVLSASWIAVVVAVGIQSAETILIPPIALGATLGGLAWVFGVFRKEESEAVARRAWVVAKGFLFRFRLQDDTIVTVPSMQLLEDARRDKSLASAVAFWSAGQNGPLDSLSNDPAIRDYLYSWAVDYSDRLGVGKPLHPAPSDEKAVWVTPEWKTVWFWLPDGISMQDFVSIPFDRYLKDIKTNGALVLDLAAWVKHSPRRSTLSQHPILLAYLRQQTPESTLAPIIENLQKAKAEGTLPKNLEDISPPARGAQHVAPAQGSARENTPSAPIANRIPATRRANPIADSQMKQVEELRASGRDEQDIFKDAAAGDMTAQFELGYRLSGKEDQKSEAINWFLRAANQGHLAAQMNLQNCYEFGYGIAKDPVEAAKWCKKLAEQDYTPAAHQLGWKYKYGEGIEQDHSEAARWYRVAAEGGELLSAVRLGEMYIRGDGVPQDASEGLRWLFEAGQRAIEVKDVNIMSALGNTSKRIGRFAEGLQWHKMSAKLGDASSMIEAADYYREGLGVEKDFTMMAAWYMLAAEKDDETGKLLLAKCYELGVGAPKDYVQALAWYKRSRGSQDKAASLAEQMTPDQIAETDRIVSEWKPNFAGRLVSEKTT